MGTGRRLDTKTTPLRVRVLHVDGGDGSTSDQLSVFCSLEQRAVSVDHCVQCSECESIYLDPSDRESFLVCGRAAEPSDPVATAPVRSVEGAPAVRTIMSVNVVCVAPDFSVESLLSLFIDRGFSGAPVVDEDGRPIGIVSKTDLLSARFMAGETMEERERPLSFVTERGYQVELEGGFHATDLASATVADVMSPLVFSLPEGATIPQAAALMAYEGVHRAPVVSVDDKVVGIVSSIDVLRWIGQEYGFVVPDRRPRGRSEGA